MTRYRTRTVRFAEARSNDGQRLLAFNELFIGAASHVSARYRITFNDKVEDHSSSGIIISTPAGGVIFSDGIESDFLQFNSGATARIGISRETANLVI